MQKKKYKLTSRQGLTVKPAMALISKAMEFKSDIFLKVFSKEIDFKSLMGILSLEISCGTEIEVIAVGADEKAAILAITNKLKDLDLAIEL